MAICRNKINDILKNTEEELSLEQEGICITTPNNDFNREIQIGNDSIDLRISNKGYVINEKYKFINTLSDVDYNNNTDYFKGVNLNLEEGYDLEPGQVLFINTVERVQLKGDFIGEIMGRSVFSRFGLSVHCTQSKFASGINSIVPLQIKNNINIPLKIFPYQKLVQLVIHKTEFNKYPYTGQYSSEYTYRLPVVGEKDRIQYDERTKSIIKNIKPSQKTFLDEDGKRKEAKYITMYQTATGVVLSVFISFMGIFGVNSATITLSILSIFLYLGSSIFLIRMQN